MTTEDQSWNCWALSVRTTNLSMWSNRSSPKWELNCRISSNSFIYKVPYLHSSVVAIMNDLLFSKVLHGEKLNVLVGVAILKEKQELINDMDTHVICTSKCNTFWAKKLCMPWLILHLDMKCNAVVSEQEKMNATQSYHRSQADQLRTDIAALKKQESSTRQTLEAKVCFRHSLHGKSPHFGDHKP
jgi:hypothetical protein